MGRVLLPPSGITALIEFIEPSEARVAFTKLAYSKFKNLPLYLEWAPENTFLEPYNPTNTNVECKSPTTEEKITSEPLKVDKNNDEKKITNEIDDDDDPEENTTLFIKNLNFETREPAIKEVRILYCFRYKRKYLNKFCILHELFSFYLKTVFNKKFILLAF